MGSGTEEEESWLILPSLWQPLPDAYRCCRESKGEISLKHDSHYFVYTSSQKPCGEGASVGHHSQGFSEEKQLCWSVEECIGLPSTLPKGSLVSKAAGLVA